jgi:hypothetical protein
MRVLRRQVKACTCIRYLVSQKEIDERSFDRRATVLLVAFSLLLIREKGSPMVISAEDSNTSNDDSVKCCVSCRRPTFSRRQRKYTVQYGLTVAVGILYLTIDMNLPELTGLR